MHRHVVCNDIVEVLRRESSLCEDLAHVIQECHTLCQQVQVYVYMESCELCFHTVMILQRVVISGDKVYIYNIQESEDHPIELAAELHNGDHEHGARERAKDVPSPKYLHMSPLCIKLLSVSLVCFPNVK